MSFEMPPPPLMEQASETQDKAEFLMMLRARGIQDLNLLRAVETVPREIFVPHRFADLARRPIALPLRCGQTLPEPWVKARMIEALAPSPRHRILEIGTGSGFRAKCFLSSGSRASQSRQKSAWHSSRLPMRRSPLATALRFHRK
jgi:protein-L-isoaspartate(D-aspartate) O-methyltransferase